MVSSLIELKNKEIWIQINSTFLQAY
jgi:hypothetical protein